MKPEDYRESLFINRMKRVFIAIKIDPSKELISVLNTLKLRFMAEKINWINPSNIHITLAFLGNIEEDRISVVKTLLKEICAESAEFSFVLRGTGVFKNFREPRVIWMGTGESGKLISLGNRIISGLKSTGFEIEERPFNPHITLGRIKFLKETANLKSALEEFQESHIQEVNLNEVILYESILNPEGPVYKALSRFSLKPDPGIYK